MRNLNSMRELERVLKALANRRRLLIIAYLRKNKEAKVGDIASEIKLSFKATSKHLSLLLGANIVEREQRGLQMWYCLSVNQHAVSKYISNSFE